MRSELPRRQHGSTLIGLVAGVVIGLLIAVAVAIYITNAPVPFINKVQRPTENVQPGADGKLPDPNKPLNSAPPLPPPAATAVPLKTDPPKATDARATPAAASAPPDDSTRFMLQAGAYRTAADADAMRAQLAMLGLDARVFPVEQAGAALYRVRLGPYGERPEVERIRKQMNDAGITSQIIPMK